MSGTQIISNYELFTDINGEPLEAGYVWIGQPSTDPRLFPLPVYFDAALTIPATMPLRTSNGYIDHNGARTFIYIDGNYSIRVENKNTSLIYSVVDFLATGSRLDSGMVRWTPQSLTATPTRKKSVFVNNALDDSETNFFRYCTASQRSAIRNGVTTTGQDSAWVDALGEAADNRRGGIFLPEGTFTYDTDIRVLSGRFRLRGAGGQTILRGNTNARFILGEAIPVIGGPKPVKTGTKIVGATMRDMAFHPQDNHAGEVILVDFADNVKFENIHAVNPFNQNGSTITHGIKTNWVQWITLDNVETQVNGYGLYILLPVSDKENEDHYAIKNSRLFGSKTPFAGFDPAAICVEREVGRNAPVWQFGLTDVHIGKFTTGGAGIMHGLLVKTNFSSDNVTLQIANLHNTWFEAVDYPVDLLAGQAGATADGSHISMSGSSSSLGATVVFRGGDFTKASGAAENAAFLQCGQISSGIRMYYSGRNKVLQPTGVGTATIAAEGMSRHRLANRRTGASSLDTVRLAGSGVATLPSGATSVVVTHQIAVNGVGIAPDAVSLTPQADMDVFYTAVTTTTFTINCAISTGSNRLISWDASVSEN